MVTLVKWITSVTMIILNLFTGCIFGNFTADFSPSQENCNLFFSAISDCHMTTSAVRADMLRLGMFDMEKSEQRLDAVLFCGDNTDHGYAEQYDLLAETIGKYDPADNILIAEGNHDTWTRDTDIDADGGFRQLFMQYTEQITGNHIDNVYYSTQINGYTFIVLGSEEDHTYAYFSPTQIAWLKAEMEKASQDGKPIFVISHWPINETHGLPETWGDSEPEPDDGGMGDQSDEVEAILKSYDNVFLISGHIHSGLTNENDCDLYGYRSVETDGSFHSINLPSFMYMSVRGRVANGTGFVFEVYDDQVVIRARSFTAGVWYTLYDYTFDLV